MEPKTLAIVLGVLLTGCSGGGGSSSAPPDNQGNDEGQPTRLGLLAGAVGGSGNADGVGATARFNLPLGIAVDAAGNRFVADTGNHVVRKIDATGAVTTFAGSDARFSGPQAITVDAAGNVYVADKDSNNIRRITPAGSVTTFASSIYRSSRVSSSGNFNSLPGISVDDAGNVYVADENDGTVVKVTPQGDVGVLAGSPGVQGTRDGVGSAAQFYSVKGVAWSTTGDVFVADYNRIRRISPSGGVTTFAGIAGVSGATDGDASRATFHSIVGMSMDGAGNLYILEGSVLPEAPFEDIRKITPGGAVSTVASHIGTPRVFSSQIGSPDQLGEVGIDAIGVDRAGVIYVTDTVNSVIKMIDSTGNASIVAGTPPSSGNVDGIGSVARFGTLLQIATDSSGNVYVADRDNESVRKVTAAGSVTTIFRSPGAPPVGVAVDTAGNVLAGSYDCSQRAPVVGYCLGRITRIDAMGMATPLSIRANDADATELFFFPSALATDAAGNIYVADSSGFALKKISLDGEMTIFARVANSNGIAVDRAGNVYSSYFGVVYKTSPGGAPVIFAGSPNGGTVDGLGDIGGLAIDDAGTLYVSDRSFHRIRKISPAGLVTTIAGTPDVKGFTPGPLPGVLTSPGGVAVSGANLYFAMPGAIAVIRDRP